MEQEIDSRVRIRQGAQTARITVTITREQHSRLRSLCRGSGFNASEVVRHALVQLFRMPYIFLPPDYTDNKRTVYDNRRESVPGEGESRA
ncbi:MAG: hypothetical protein J7J88_00535 [Dehalococcoidia bacterium]|nr:hypothetical protein [Dehalococcoidia bacterium]